MEREVAWKKYDEASLDELEALAVDYIDFISENKTERECAAAAIAAAEDAGYDSLADCIAAGTAMGPGSKLWACALIKGFCGRKPGSLQPGRGQLGWGRREGPSGLKCVYTGRRDCLPAHRLLFSGGLYGIYGRVSG